MKRLILCSIIAFGLTGWVNAQTSSGSSSTSSSGTMQSSDNGQVAKKNKKGTKKNTQLNNRKIYKGKNGQRATPTGHEATGTNSGYSAIGRDTSRKEKQ